MRKMQRKYYLKLIDVFKILVEGGHIQKTISSGLGTLYTVFKKDENKGKSSGYITDKEFESLCVRGLLSCKNDSYSSERDTYYCDYFLKTV